jgi:single-strand DNA-binding protein
MEGLNRVLLIGNLTRDPVTRATSGGMSICELGLALNRRYRTAAGEERDEVCYVDIDAFGKQAEQCSRYLRKGALVFVEGRLRLDQWEDRATNQKRSRLKVTAERVQFMDSRPRDGGGDAGGEAGPATPDHDDAPAAPRAAAPAPYARPAAAASGPRPPAARPPPPPPEHESQMPSGTADEEAVDDIPF